LSARPDARSALEALHALQQELRVAIRDEADLDSISLVGDLTEVSKLALWCRDAGLRYARMNGFTWAEMAAVCGVSDSTIQSRVEVWERRGGVEQCG
jgi:hypothetical protein